MKKLVVCIAAGIFLVGCSKTDEITESTRNTSNTGTNNSGCDTVGMKYAKDVQPILSARCYSCHGNGKATSGVALDDYNQLKQKALSGTLVGVISHSPGYPAMPYKLPKLSDCEINKIKDWVERGALNN